MIKTSAMFSLLLIMFTGFAVHADTEEQELQQEIKDLTAQNEKMSKQLEETKAEIEKGNIKMKLSRREKREIERNSPVPYKEKRNKKLNYGIRMTNIGPYGDNSVNVLFTHGLGFIQNVNKNIAFGVKDMSFDIFETIYGLRATINFAPVVELSMYPIKPVQIGSEIGVMIQGQFSKGEESSAAIVPFISIINQYFVLPKFSFGPTAQLNIVAKGEHHMVAPGEGKPSTIPQKGAWIDAGIQFSFHF